MVKRACRGVWVAALALNLAAPAALASARPPLAESTFSADSKFVLWNQELLEKSPGRDVALLDLDALDHNIDQVRARLGRQFQLRIVTKSLPSIPLIRYILRRAQTNRIMAFSEGLLTAILEEFGDSVDILLGRPMPVESARRVLSARPAARHVHWLVDTRERMTAYAALARSIHARLCVAVEIDVGLRRGGALDVAALNEILQVVAANEDCLRFVGFMGYDGHVPAAPEFGLDPDAEFAAVHARYAEFVRAGARAFPNLFSGDRVYNSGGSRTYARYGEQLTSTPVNDVALGSAFLTPSNFSDLKSLTHIPASFLASPVLKRIQPAEVPFVLGYLPSLAESNPSLQVAFYMVGASFPGDIIAPEGLVQNPFIPGAGVVRNLLPNQMLMNGAASLPLSVGDFVFHQTWEGDGLAWLDSVLLLRGGAIVGEWDTFREGPARKRQPGPDRISRTRAGTHP